jgi:hypothetical protein
VPIMTLALVVFDDLYQDLGRRASRGEINGCREDSQPSLDTAGRSDYIADLIR